MDSRDGAENPLPSSEATFDSQLRSVLQSVLADSLPALEERITQRVLEAAEAAIAHRVQEARAEVEAYRMAQSAQQEPSAPPLPGSAAPPSGDSVAEAIKWGIAYLPKAFAESLDTYDKLVTIRMKQANPAVLMAQWSQTNPDILAFLSQKYAPDPLQNYLPALLAKNSVDTANAVTRALVRQGYSLGRGGRIATDPFDEPQEESDSPSDSSEPERAVMQRRRRRTTLREALG